MDILGIGIDIVECAHIGDMIERHGPTFLARVFTEYETQYCQARRRAVEHFAGRWAAKEAVVKALGTGWNRGIGYCDVEVQHAGTGTPKIVLRGAARDLAKKQEIETILITISHCEAYAVAQAIAVSAGAE